MCRLCSCNQDCTRQTITAGQSVKRATARAAISRDYAVHCDIRDVCRLSDSQIKKLQVRISHPD